MTTHTHGTPIPGLMQDWALTTDKFIDHAARWHGSREVAFRQEDNAIGHKPYAAVRDDAARLSNALLAHGLRPGDRVGTLATNGIRHLEAWYGITGIGAICHTLNPRLFLDQLVYIINHAADRILFAEAAFAQIVESLLPLCPTLERVIFLTGSGTRVPGTASQGDIADFIDGHPSECRWGEFEENTAAGLCYTSGTTGNPKGVLYSHRSNFLHTLTSVQPDIFNISARDAILAVVPMYHANGWCFPFSALAVGAKLVLPGGRLDGLALFELMEAERVTMTAGVPTVWLSLLDYLTKTGQRPTTLERVYVGGAACSERILRDFAALDIEVIQAWGMTELSPLAGVSSMTPSLDKLSFDEQMPWRLKQGRSPVGVELKLVDENGMLVPHNGETAGYLRIRGCAVTSGYFKSDAAILDEDGYFDTGDIATIDPEGFVQITDRAKDIIKSGGEWISSIEVENAALSHPAVELAAVIGVPHLKWGERPRLYVQVRAGEPATRADLLNHLAGRLARWWLPDEVTFLDVIPLGATGKVDKKALRALASGS
jgi:fatty-acyl-CoA synthase